MNTEKNSKEKCKRTQKNSKEKCMRTQKSAMAQRKTAKKSACAEQGIIATRSYCVCARLKCSGQFRVRL